MSSDSLGKGCGTKLEGMRDVVALCSWCITPNNFSSGSLLEVFLLFWQIEELCIISKFKISNFESLFRKRRRRSFHGFGF